MIQPEPWREGVPPEIQRVLEDAFATLASRVRALLNVVHYNSVDETVRGRPFVQSGKLSSNVRDGGCIRSWNQLAQTENPESTPPVLFNLMDAPIEVLQLEKTVSDPSARPQWDTFCQSGRSVHRYNPSCEQIEYSLKSLWPLMPRDQQLISASRTLPNGGRMYVATSLPTHLAPPPKKGVLRARLMVGGHYVMPRPGGVCDGGVPVPWDGQRAVPQEGGEGGGGENGGGGDGVDSSLISSSPAVNIVSILHVDLQHGVPRSIYWFVSRKMAYVMENFRKFAVKRGLATGSR